MHFGKVYIGFVINFFLKFRHFDLTKIKLKCGKIIIVIRLIHNFLNKDLFFFLKDSFKINNNKKKKRLRILLHLVPLLPNLKT